MKDIKTKIIDILVAVVGKDDISLEMPPKQDMGDYAFPCFSLSKEWKRSPHAIADELTGKVKDKLPDELTVKAIGPYLNFFVRKDFMAEVILTEIKQKGLHYADQEKKDITVLVESPGPNTNKPLHLGHLRNMLLGSSIAKILTKAGKDVHMINVVNDRGIHICKSMLAYQMFGNNQTPEQAQSKSDHFVGDFYVKYSKMEKENPDIEKEAQDMVVKWEQGDKEIHALWNKMNKWALDGFNETYDKLNFKIEKEYFESDTYKHGKDIILKGLNDGIFTKNDAGAVVVDLEDKNLGTKVLLRANGTSVYITQDIYMAKLRNQDFNFDEMIYVVGNEQDYHFNVLFEVFKKLGWEFGDDCYHFSYGMVELPEGKMKSREGNVVDTDELLSRMTSLAKKEVEKRYKHISEDEINNRANKIGMAAVNFFFLKFDPLKNFVFNPEESLSFEGETGPYVQYAYARICSIFKKLETKVDLTKVHYSQLNTDFDKKLLILMSNYPEKLADAANNRKPSLIAHYLIDLASAFNEYYHANPILKENPETRNARLALIDSVKTVLKSGLKLLGIDVLEQM